MAETQDRFYVQKDKHATFQALSEKAEGPFDYIKDVFVFSAAVGYRFDRRVPLENPKQHVGFWHYLSESRDQPLLQAIAIAESGGLDVLADRGEVITIAEEFANGGLSLVTSLDSFDRDATLVALAAEVLDIAGALDAPDGESR